MIKCFLRIAEAIEQETEDFDTYREGLVKARSELDVNEIRPDRLPSQKYFLWPMLK